MSVIDDRILNFPNLPTELEGLRIAHLTDSHIDRPKHPISRFANLLSNRRLDLLLMTGDYMDRPGNEEDTLNQMKKLLSSVRPKFGTFAVFGNHDSDKGRELLQQLDADWLFDEPRDIEGLPLQLIGIDGRREQRPDSLNVALNIPPRGDSNVFRIAMCHFPDWLHCSSDMSIDLLLSGHTHGGQMRLPGGQAIINHSDLPLRMSSGVLRRGKQLCAISRGVGEAAGPLLNFRLLCPRQLPIYTLHRGPLPGRAIDKLHMATRW